MISETIERSGVGVGSVLNVICGANPSYIGGGDAYFSQITLSAVSDCKRVWVFAFP